MAWFMGLLGVSGLKTVFVASGELTKKKQELIQSSVPISELNEYGKEVLVHHQNTIPGCGIIEIYKKIISSRNTVVVVNNDKSHVDLYGARSVETIWEDLCKIPHKLDMEIPNCVPPKNLSNVLFPCDRFSVTMFGSPDALTEFMKTSTGSSIHVAEGQFKVIQRHFNEGEKVFMYGKKEKKESSFQCELMGTDSQQIVDSVYSNESTNNALKAILFTGGSIISVLCIGSALMNH